MELEGTLPDLHPRWLLDLGAYTNFPGSHEGTQTDKRYIRSQAQVFGPAAFFASKERISTRNQKSPCYDINPNACCRQVIACKRRNTIPLGTLVWLHVVCNELSQARWSLRCILLIVQLCPCTKPTMPHATCHIL